MMWWDTAIGVVALVLVAVVVLRCRPSGQTSS
jgi:hypothetical protein